MDIFGLNYYSINEWNFNSCGNVYITETTTIDIVFDIISKTHTYSIEHKYLTNKNTKHVTIFFELLDQNMKVYKQSFTTDILSESNFILIKSKIQLHFTKHYYYTYHNNHHLYILYDIPTIIFVGENTHIYNQHIQYLKIIFAINNCKSVRLMEALKYNGIYNFIFCNDESQTFIYNAGNFCTHIYYGSVNNYILFYKTYFNYIKQCNIYINESINISCSIYKKHIDYENMFVIHIDSINIYDTIITLPYNIQYLYKFGKYLYKLLYSYDIHHIKCPSNFITQLKLDAIDTSMLSNTIIHRSCIIYV